jgi:hypothetical protein
MRRSWLDTCTKGVQRVEPEEFMEADRRSPDSDGLAGPLDVGSQPAAARDGAEASAPSTDPNDEIPVPVAMYPSEIDERAQVVEALREDASLAEQERRAQP